MVENKHMDKKAIYVGLIIGSVLGSYVPTWFGAGIFSVSSVLGGAVGGILGIWLVYKLSN
ncbi:MAG: hypothetical protein WCJ74_02525 [bacterium]